MSSNCKKEKPKKCKNFTELEKETFKRIMSKYTDIIECKKADNITIGKKKKAWEIICEEYNASALIGEERNMDQLKKLWNNMKSAYREALTKEKQSQLKTGGGPAEPEAVIDPVMSQILPHVMVQAPTLFTSNMTEEEVIEKRTEIYRKTQEKIVNNDFNNDNEVDIIEYIDDNVYNAHSPDSGTDTDADTDAFMLNTT